MFDEELISVAKKIGYQQGINKACRTVRERFENETFNSVSEMKVALYETLVGILAEATDGTAEAES